MTTFSTSISGVVPLSNIYETPNVVHQTPPPSSWVDMLFPQIHTGSDSESDGEYSDGDDDDNDTPEPVYDDIPGYGAPIEGMKGKKKKKRKGKSRTGKDDAKRLFKKVLNGIKKGIDIFTKVSYFLPGKVDKGLTKLTTKATDSIYNVSDKKPGVSTKKNVRIIEQRLRREFNVEKVITAAEEVFQKITNKLNTANNEEAFKTKQLLKDDFQSFIYKIRNMNIATINGEDAYKNLLLSIRSIEKKLKELYEKANAKDMILDQNDVFKELGSVLNPKKFLKYLKDETCIETNKRVQIVEDFVKVVEKFNKKVYRHLKKYQQIGAEPYVNDYKKLTAAITKIYYVNPLKFKSKLNEIKKMYNRIKQNSSYYVFDSEIKELTKVAEEFRFEKNAKTLEIPPDNSKLEADKRNDASVLKKVVYMLMAVPFLIIATYNWYYLIVYRDTDQFADAPPSPDGKEPRAVNDRTQIKWDFSALGPIADIVDHLFGSLIFPTRLLNRILLEHKSPVIPGFFTDKYPLISRACVLGLFAFLIYGMFFKVSLKELIKSDSKCKPKQNNLVVKLFMGLIIFYYVFRMLFIFFGGSHTGGFMSTLADNMAVRPLNFGFKPFLSRPILAIILFILLMVGLFFIAMLSVNMSIMIVMMYLVLHSLFGFYMYLPTTGSGGRGLFKDIFMGFSYYRDTWSKLSNIFDGERKEWKDLEKCEDSTPFGRFMIYVMGRIFTWFWFVIMLTGIIFTLVKTRLNEMKVFTSIMIAILGGIFMYISWKWEDIMNAIFGKKETESTTTDEATTSAETNTSDPPQPNTTTPSQMIPPNTNPLNDLLGSIGSPEKLISEFTNEIENNPDISPKLKQMGNTLMEQVKTGNLSGALETFNTLKDSVPPGLIPPELTDKLSSVQSMTDMLKSVNSIGAPSSAAPSSGAESSGSESSGAESSAAESLGVPNSTSGLLGSIKEKIPSIAPIIDTLSKTVPPKILEQFLGTIPSNKVEAVIKTIPSAQINELLQKIPVKKITKVLNVIPSDLLSSVVNILPLDEISQIINSNPKNIQQELMGLAPKVMGKITNPMLIYKLRGIIPKLLTALA